MGNLFYLFYDTLFLIINKSKTMKKTNQEIIEFILRIVSIILSFILGTTAANAIITNIII